MSELDIFVALKDDEVVYVGNSISIAKQILREKIEEEYEEDFDEDDSFYADLGDDVEIQAWNNNIRKNREFFNHYKGLKENE